MAAATSVVGVRNEYYTVEASTLTGVQSYNLCGNRSERPNPASPGFDTIPFVGVVDKCFGSCGHPLQHFSGDVNELKHGGCYNCNVRNVVIAWSAYIVPRWRAAALAGCATLTGLSNLKKKCRAWVSNSRPLG